ncbi:HlyD family type I secretion periplasmic adaptor subunit [Shewanella sp. 1_MG-2023]|uniref:HlyD family type I secretion periplasmic adaptor subunit n=1 Tax=unclassified Shewanella TaxID=196818 RepID=UPI0026E27846|nr:MULTISPECIES: HlyD family type I secretion periplasmic adaptor subunit [unclassified Shewanella]MDO6612664.1 HlyD family type I secretion periplasmic adaptor subunit [Shewanella sp. 7_MG-2023]MDO6772363.1 HlyD family type I secretion periplasmic adaptor subunit [Shewanella sp. 2_MG-2023]MDO6796561.1 HlyD family type I secretion periplasmic adaptor subunit [Shewanella sp. 1_MG-2023]
MSVNLHIKHLEGAKRANRVILLTFGLLCFTLIWAAFATLEEVVVGEGKVVPASAVQQIESLDGGSLKEILVKEGDTVIAGQTLLVIDELRFASAFHEARLNSVALKNQLTRLEALLDSVLIDDTQALWFSQVQITPQQFDIADSSANRRSQAIYNSQLSQLISQLDQTAQIVEQKRQAKEEVNININAQRSGLTMAKQEIRMTREAVGEGAVAELELLKLERDAVRLQGELSASQASERQLKAAISQAVAERRNVALDFVNRTTDERNKTSNELSALTENMKALADRLERTQITSPVSGSVSNIVVRSAGQVVEPGQVLMEVVPQDDQLIIESHIAPKDIAFVHKGLKAMVKFTAYDFVIYGGIKGEVIYVSPDAQQLEDGTTYYEAHIQTDENQLNGWPIISGMQASTDILTGNKTVLNYWLKPLLRARANALREP